MCAAGTNRELERERRVPTIAGSLIRTRSRQLSTSVPKAMGSDRFLCREGNKIPSTPICDPVTLNCVGMTAGDFSEFRSDVKPKGRS
jgi:hypothetical protein